MQKQQRNLFSTSAIRSIGILIVVIFIMQSCKKGDTGPAGANGATGTANVSYSEWFTATSYVKDTVFGIWGFTHTRSAPAITQAILDSGSVLVYAKLLGYNPLVWPTSQVGQLPITLTYVQSGVNVDTWSARISEGNIRIRFVNDKNTYGSIATTHQFRYIIIPGGKKIPNAVRRQPNGLVEAQITPDTENAAHNGGELSYSELCRQLGIVE